MSRWDRQMISQRYRTGMVGVAGGVLVTASILGLATKPRLDDSMLLLLPGILLSALFFSEGIHSNSPFAFIAVAAVANILLYAALVALAFEAIKKRKARKAQSNG